MGRSLLLLCLATCCPALSALAAGPSNVVVVVNGNTAESVDLGRYYAARRCLPPGNVVTVHTTTEPETSWKAFRQEVVAPLRVRLARESFEGVDFLVLARGLPLRVSLPGGWVSATALLSVLDTDLPGRPQTARPSVANPYCGADRPFSHRTALGGLRLYLATALTGYTLQDAKQLVDRSVRADRSGGTGLFVFQEGQGNGRFRNSQYAEAARDLRQRGYRTLEARARTGALASAGPLMGLLSAGPYSAMTAAEAGGLAFKPGAVVDLLESFGAVPENFEAEKAPRQIPAALLVRAGATGVHGTVAEPWSNAFCKADLFRWYVAGYTLAEAFYQSLPFLYWQNLVLGDPLCAPYAHRPVVTVRARRTGGTGPWSVTVGARPSSGRTGVKSVALYVDGVKAGEEQGDGAVFVVPLGPGRRHLLAVARGRGRVEPEGWAAVFVTSRP